jgi:hypothetical protein
VFVDAMSNDDGDVAKVECGRRDVEDGYYGLGGANTDKIETATESNNEPNGVDGCLGVIIDFTPEAVARC